MATRPGLVGFRISATHGGPVDWPSMAAMWSMAADLGVLDAGWMSDHLTNAGRERGGAAYESMTTLAALAARARGLWVGVVVASNTFRHPAVLAKQATALDHVTGGRFVLGLGAGWHEGEHDQFGIPLPPMRERFDRFESALRVLSALFSDAARTSPGVTLDDPFYPLHEATNEPPPLRPEGPAIWVGAGQRRGIGLAVRYADGWPMPGNRPEDVRYFAEKRDEIRRALDAAGRDPDDFTFAAQMSVGASGAELREARETALAFRRAGANHVIVGVDAGLGSIGLAAMASEVAVPLREAAR